MARVDRVLHYEFGQPHGVVNIYAHVTQSQVLTHLPIQKLSSRFGFLLFHSMILGDVSSLNDVIHCIIAGQCCAELPCFGEVFKALLGFCLHVFIKSKKEMLSR